jgi:hypothetical protein
MVNTGITGTSSDDYRNIIGLPRLGGYYYQLAKKNRLVA